MNLQASFELRKERAAGWPAAERRVRSLAAS
jgi:hypothetical protein